jgi:hypothetical protein
MRLITQSLAALGNAPWVPLNYLQGTFGVTLLGSITSGASLTYKVQQTLDDFSQEFRFVSISRTTTTATVTDNDHRLSTGDSVIITGTGDANLDAPNGADITFVDANTYTYTVSNTGAATGSANSKLKSFRVFDHATMTGLVARTVGSIIGFPIMAVRLKTTIYASGKVDLLICQGFV